MTVLEKDERELSDAISAMLAGVADPGRGAVRTYSTNRVHHDLRARECYSYGRHFPLFRYVPKQLNGAADLFVINGDTWPQGGFSSRTNDHQAITRRLIAETGRASIVLPFSALNGAGLLIDSIRPVHVRADRTWTETKTARTLAEVPRHERTIGYSVERTAETLAEVPERYAYGWNGTSYGPIERGPDGRYHWHEPRTRPLEPRVDGLYEWSQHMHRLGDALFSAVRPETYSRPARPMESNREDRRAIVELCTSALNGYCDRAPNHVHEAGPGAACVHCNEPLTARVTSLARARYLSSFDTNERPALYFLARVPRGAGDTVESALESLAPRAVHAAIARGRIVERQGDIFFVDTELTRADLESRGATFARLTLWTRDAEPRRGEPGYRRPPTAADRRREQRYARKLWRERFRGAVAKAVSGETSAARPQTKRPATIGARAQYALQRARAQADVDRARADLARIVARPYRHLQRRNVYYYGAGAVQQSRNDYAREVRRAREVLEHAERRLRDAYAARVIARDNYRCRYGDNAAAAWRGAKAAAAEKFRPGSTGTGNAWQIRRERARNACSIYGTAHSATEIARVHGAVYVRGVVRHVPDLEPGRRDGPDHRPLTLTPDRWYLAIRNTVPRQTRRRAAVAA